MKRGRRIPPSFFCLATNRPRYRLGDLLEDSPDQLPRIEGWDEMRPVGRENEFAPSSLRDVQAMRRFTRAQKRRLSGAQINLRQLIDDGRD
jgi:hypothetical protein